MDADVADLEIKRAVLTYFGLVGLRTNARTLRQRLAAAAYAILLRDLLGENRMRKRVIRLAEGVVIGDAGRATLERNPPLDVDSHLEPIVRSINGKNPFLHRQRDAWLEKHGKDQQGKLGLEP